MLDTKILFHIGIGSCLGIAAMWLLQKTSSKYGNSHCPVCAHSDISKVHEMLKEIMFLVKTKEDDAEKISQETIPQSPSVESLAEGSLCNLISSNKSEPQPVYQNLQEVDAMRSNIKDSSQSKELLNILFRLNSKFPNVCGVLWRMARAYFDIAQKCKSDKVEYKRLIQLAFDFADKALHIDQSNFSAHKWFAIIISAQ
eukprot:Sdes_comp9587_c0_seq1m1069